MKRLLVIPIIFCGVFLLAQEKLIVEYEQTMEREWAEEPTVSSDSRRAQYDAAMREAMNRSTYYTLELTSNESLYKMIEKIDNTQSQDGVSVTFFSGGGLGETYKNLKENISQQSFNLYNTNIIVEDPLDSYEWEITREFKEILGYEVRKASAMADSTSYITAWYAPKLAYRNGPEAYQGLPGLILEIETSDEECKNKTLTKATSIEVKEDNKAFKSPTKGKKMSSREYEAWLIEKNEKMKAMYSSGVDKD